MNRKSAIWATVLTPVVMAVVYAIVICVLWVIIRYGMAFLIGGVFVLGVGMLTWRVLYDYFNERAAKRGK